MGAHRHARWLPGRRSTIWRFGILGCEIAKWYLAVVVAIPRPVLQGVDDPFGELAHVGGVHLRIDGEGHIEAILLDLIDVPKPIRSRPPHPLASQLIE